MKKVISLFALCTVALSAVSCGIVGGGSPSTQKDSVAYALGIDIGTSIRTNTDSTLNYEMICAGIEAAFKGDTSIMDSKEASEFLRYYFTEVKPKEMAEAGKKASVEFLANAAKTEGAQTSQSGLIYVIEDAGADQKVVYSDTVTLHYTLSDVNGNVLQSSKDMGQPMTYPNTPGAMIPGFEEGVLMLGKGGKATLFVPSEIGYGDQGSGPIAPGQALKFEIEIVDVKKAAEQK